MHITGQRDDEDTRRRAGQIRDDEEQRDKLHSEELGRGKEKGRRKKQGTKIGNAEGLIIDYGCKVV